MVMLTPLPDANGFSSGNFCVSSTVLPVFNGEELRNSSGKVDLEITPPIGLTILFLKFGRIVSRWGLLLPSDEADCGLPPAPDLSVVRLETNDGEWSDLEES